MLVMSQPMLRTDALQAPTECSSHVLRIGLFVSIHHFSLILCVLFLGLFGGPFLPDCTCNRGELCILSCRFHKELVRRQ